MPVRTTIIGAGLAIATVVAAGVFASSLDHLVKTPRLFGWNWDTQLSISADNDTPGAAEATEADASGDRGHSSTHRRRSLGGGRSR